MYIPDITERFPEGFGGVDMTSSFFPERRYGYENYYEDYDDGIEIPYEEVKQFEAGQEIRDVEFDGGVTVYGIVKFNKSRTRVYVTETWFNYDGSVKRRPHWCNLMIDAGGFEKFQPDDSYDSWISCR